MDDLIADFLAETSEGLVQLDNDLIDLEKDPNNQGLLGNIFRVMHTIKGTCGFLGMSRLEKVAHAGENVLGKIRDGECEATPDVISLVLNVIDIIKMIVERIEADGKEPEGNDDAIIAKLNAVIAKDEAESQDVVASEDGGLGLLVPDFSEGANTEDIAETVQPVSVAEVSDEPMEAPNTIQEDPKGEQTMDSGDQKEVVSKGPSTQQSLRVNLDVLELLMQQVGELVLTRNQLLQMVRKQEDSEFSSPLHRLNKITSELQEGVMQTRMQPIGSAWAQFPRLVRDLS
ncbi:MAG: Hpt domain-containing protein, partial [Rickettsiales bacterium]|nr:Hpt domain-containing protein [Rickettsiales bacterium]